MSATSTTNRTDGALFAANSPQSCEALTEPA